MFSIRHPPYGCRSTFRSTPPVSPKTPRLSAGDGFFLPTRYNRANCLPAGSGWKINTNYNYVVPFIRVHYLYSPQTLWFFRESLAAPMISRGRHWYSLIKKWSYLVVVGYLASRFQHVLKREKQTNYGTVKSLPKQKMWTISTYEIFRAG